RRCGCALLRVLVAECQVVALASALVVVGLPVAWVAAVVWARPPATGGVPPSNRRRILVVGCVGPCVLPAAGPLIGQMTVAVGVCRLGGGPLKTSQGSARRTRLLGTRSAGRSGGDLLPRWRRCWWRSRHGCSASGRVGRTAVASRKKTRRTRRLRPRLRRLGWSRERYPPRETPTLRKPRRPGRPPLLPRVRRTPPNTHQPPTRLEEVE